MAGSHAWVTSNIGYPNFLAESDNLAKTFRGLAAGAVAGVPYEKAKEDVHRSLEVTLHAVETRKAAFQEYGLLFVKPRSNRISLTPLGDFIWRLAETPEQAMANRQDVLFALARGLARYQFHNPAPVGSERGRDLAKVSDVRPYLMLYYLMRSLNGLLFDHELYGVVFELMRMADLPAAINKIHAARRSGTPFPRIAQIPNSRSGDNLGIYFMAHLGLANTIVKHQRLPSNYYELTPEGWEIVSGILEEADSRKHPQPSQPYTDKEDYFRRIVGGAPVGTVGPATIPTTGESSGKISRGRKHRPSTRGGTETVPIRQTTVGNNGSLAERLAAERLRDSGWEVMYVGHLGLGYDLQAQRDGLTLMVEVKSSNKAISSVELTENEWNVCRANPDKYILCLVSKITMTPEFAYGDPYRPDLNRRRRTCPSCTDANGVSSRTRRWWPSASTPSSSCYTRSRG